MIYWKLIEIAIITVIIIDISGIVDSIKEFIGKTLNITNVRLKPLTCSFCMTFWCCLCYVVPRGYTSLEVLTFILLMSTLTPVISDLIYLVRDIFGKIILKINDLIQ